MAQMDENWTLMKDGQSDTINRGDWLAANLKSGKEYRTKILQKWQKKHLVEFKLFVFLP